MKTTIFRGQFVPSLRLFAFEFAECLSEQYAVYSTEVAYGATAYGASRVRYGPTGAQATPGATRIILLYHDTLCGTNSAVPSLLSAYCPQLLRTDAFVREYQALTLQACGLTGKAMQRLMVLPFPCDARYWLCAALAHGTTDAVHWHIRTVAATKVS
eukprot:1482063-Rhodomonas_salina.1